MNYIKEINIRGADYSGAMLPQVVPFDTIFRLNDELSILNVNRLNRKDGKSEQIHAIRFLRPGKMLSVDRAVSLRLNRQEGIWTLRIEHPIMTFFCASRPCFHHQSPADGAVPLFAATGSADQLS